MFKRSSFYKSGYWSYTGLFPPPSHHQVNTLINELEGTFSGWTLKLWLISEATKCHTSSQKVTIDHACRWPDQVNPNSAFKIITR